MEDIPTGVQNRFLVVASALKVTIQEDPLRVKYPVYAQDSTLPEVLLEDISTEEDFNGSAFRVKQAGKGQSYVYKKIDRSFYQPNDTWVLLTELKNLKLLRGKSHIVQLGYIVVSSNPYQTISTRGSPLVTRGFLLEYHPQGTLEDRLQKADSDAFPWKSWPLQIGYDLLHLHQNEITHMDLKPSNVVIDIHGNALLIDISGVGGITPEWTAPEMRDQNFLNVSQKERAQSDIWAYGKIMCALAQSRNWGDDVAFLREAVTETTRDDPDMRIGLLDAISKLQESGERWTSYNLRTLPQNGEGLALLLLKADFKQRQDTVRVTDAKGRTALDWATAQARLSDIRLLIARGSPLNTMYVSGRTRLPPRLPSASSSRPE
ncbi:MAG: hypothetical protein Q9196_000158 [Gyalolechia fulgens]